MKKASFLLYILAGFLSNQNLQAQQKYVPSAKDTIWAKQFLAISGPGKEVSGNGHGGWRSGTDGVRYKGKSSKT
ncbi:hypothetical protein [Chryseobacterium indoltheticum]|uniref:hypothetical protein n=1 Tax=Chryseobacterium indoltheticum TaxID=254 RepID=UPI003F498C95